MTACYRVVTLLAISSCMLRADLTLKIRDIAGAGQTTEATEYYKGNLMRLDSGPGYEVVDFSTGRSFSVDPEKKEYHQSDRAKMAPKQVVDPLDKMFIEVNWSATGEQREWFGYAAHRYLATKKSHQEFNGKSTGGPETLQTDTWVLDFPVPPHVHGIAGPNANFVLGAVRDGVLRVPDVKTTQSGPVPQGLIVWLKGEHYESEVVALSVAPLDESLFGVPKGFSEVALPPLPWQVENAYRARPRSWTDQLALEWLRLRAWLDSLLGS